MVAGFNRLEAVRVVMQWVRINEEKQRARTLRAIADDLDMSPATVTRLVKVYYPECFVVEDRNNVLLTGKWPNDTVFDWETLKPLETPEVDAKFRAAKTKGIKDAFAQPQKKETDWVETQYSLDIVDKVLENGANVTVETLINFVAIENKHKPILDGLRALVELLELKGPEKKPDFFHEVTGLHYAYPREVAK